MTQPRSVGIEHVGLHAASELGLLETLNELGINGVVQASILGNLIGRMGQPGSELATWNWLQRHSALGELIDVDFGSMSHMSLYRASDVLMKHRAVIETHLFGTARTLIVNYPDDVWCYDLGSVMGIVVDGHPVCGKAHLDGVHVVDIGTRRIKLATTEGLLI